MRNTSDVMGLTLKKSKRSWLGSFAPPVIQRARQGTYRALGQTAGGRYLAVFFALRSPGRVYPITARDMDAKERRAYQRRRSR